MNKYSNLFSPIKICNYIYRNRIITGPTMDEIHIKVDDVPEAFMEKAKESIRDCAVGAIRFTK